MDAVLKQYDALTEEQKALLPTAEKEKIEVLKAAFAGPSEEDQQIAEDFTEAVNALPTNKAGEVKAQLDSMTELLSSMTEEQKALIPESTMAAYQEAVDAFEPGRQFCSGDGYYKVLSNGDVTYHHPADKTITSAVVPNQVKKGKFLFKVIKVSNIAFDGCENLLWIVIHSIPFLHPGLERETNRVFIFPVDITCHHCYYTLIKNALWQALPMFHAADWSRRKPEIADAFRQTLPLSAAADSGFYPELLTQIDVSSNQGPMLVVSIMNDVIMAARREERPATPLGDLFGLAKV